MLYNAHFTCFTMHHYLIFPNGRCARYYGKSVVCWESLYYWYLLPAFVHVVPFKYAPGSLNSDYTDTILVYAPSVNVHLIEVVLSECGWVCAVDLVMAVNTYSWIALVYPGLYCCEWLISFDTIRYMDCWYGISCISGCEWSCHFIVCELDVAGVLWGPISRVLVLQLWSIRTAVKLVKFGDMVTKGLAWRYDSNTTTGLLHDIFAWFILQQPVCLHAAFLLLSGGLSFGFPPQLLLRVSSCNGSWFWYQKPFGGHF